MVFLNTFAGHSADEPGVQEKVAMTISGHKTRSVFDRYNIISPKQVLDAMKQVERSDGRLLKVDGSKRYGRNEVVRMLYFSWNSGAEART